MINLVPSRNHVELETATSCDSSLVQTSHLSMRRTLLSACRRYSTPSASKTAYLLSLLQNNPELSASDAENELRWIRQETAGRSSAERNSAVEDLVQRRAKGEPLQYVLGMFLSRLFTLTEGNTDFGPLTLLTRAPVLIPRPETAFIVEQLESMLPHRPLNVLDLCTGSGCIPLLLAHLRQVNSWGVDINPTAIALANENAEQLAKAQQLKQPVRFFSGDILSPSFAADVRNKIGRVDLITANPPYIPQEEYDALPVSVRNWEDKRALFADDVGSIPGVAFYARIAELAMEIIQKDDAPQIRIAVEIGATQGEAVSNLLPGATQVVQDQWGRDRMVIASF